MLGLLVSTSLDCISHLALAYRGHVIWSSFLSEDSVVCGDVTFLFVVNVFKNLSPFPVPLFIRDSWFPKIHFLFLLSHLDSMQKF